MRLLKGFTCLSAYSLTLCASSALAAEPAPAEAESTASASSTANSYVQTNFIANKAQYNPAIGVEEKFINAWGIAIRPAGAGGHFWITAKDISYEYVGDVQSSPDETLRKLHTDNLKYVKVPVGGEEAFSTSVVFSDSKEHFTLTQNVDGAEPITAPAKFIFASDGGIISAWTERKKADGGFDRPQDAKTMVDMSAEGAQFFGLAISANYSKLYAANFGAKPEIVVFDGNYKRLPVTFAQPFDTNKNGRVDAGEYAPFNIQAMQTPLGRKHVFVTYAKTQPCPQEEIEKKTCEKGQIFAGEEDTSKPGYGKLAEFTEEGKLVAVWDDAGKLSAPWGMAFAPMEGFGALSGSLLVANFGDGSIAAYDADKRTFKDFLRDSNGKPVNIDKIWGLLFGNGESLGDKNALYFTAGPEDETDGIFGSLRAGVAAAPKK